MLYSIDKPGTREGVGLRLRRSPASICDYLVLEALQPVDVLEIGCRGQVLESSEEASTTCSVESLRKAVSIMAQHEFDAIVLGTWIADAWPTAAYEQIAQVAGATPVVVQTGQLRPMVEIKQLHQRQQDVIVATTKPSPVLARLVLTAILLRRVLAEEPTTTIG